MRIVLALAMGLAGATALAADMDCNKGMPWRLPLTPPGFTTVEASIKIEGKEGQLVLICNCTADVTGKNTGVWVRSSSEISTVSEARHRAKPRQATGGTNPYYLPGKSCALAGNATVILAPTDAVETSGYFQLQPQQ